MAHRFLDNSIKWLSRRDSDSIVDLNHKISCAVGVLDDLIRKLKVILPLLVHLDTRISVTDILNLNGGDALESCHAFETLCSKLEVVEQKHSPSLSKCGEEFVGYFEQLREICCRRMKLLHRFEKQKFEFLQKIMAENRVLEERVARQQAKFDETVERLDHPRQDLIESIAKSEQLIESHKANQSKILLATFFRQEKATSQECMELDRNVRTFETLRDASDANRRTFMKEDLEKEMAQLGKMNKVQVNLKAWFDKYDKGVGPLLLELVDLEAERDELQAINRDLKYNQIRPNEAYYFECMALQEQWRREAIEARLKVMRMNRCALIIQKWYRGILKGRRKKKKGKKRRGRKGRR